MSERKQKNGPLVGVRVIDLTNIFMGPLATRMLGDLGADVIKVEAREGDSTRRLGAMGDQGLGPIFLGINRNKRSIVIDLKNGDGTEVFRRLIMESDVLVTNMRPAAMARLGLSPETVCEWNSRLIYTRLVGFSQQGPYAKRAAFDDMIQAATGFADMLGKWADAEPFYVPITIADRTVGVYAFGVVSAALYEREKSGVGQVVDVPMFETMIDYVLGDHLYGKTFIPAQGDFSYPRLMSKFRRPYKTRNGFICCTIYTDAQWREFLRTVGKERLMEEDHRFADLRSRTAAIDDLYELVDTELGKKTTEEWLKLFQDIPIFPLHSFESLLTDPHLEATEYFKVSDDPIVGNFRQTKIASEWSRTHSTNYERAPLLGENTRDVLSEIGFSDKEINGLLENGAVF